MKLKFLSLYLCLICLIALPLNAQAKPFSFHDIYSLKEMTAFLKSTFPLGSKRDKILATLVENGGALLEKHPTIKRVEKYTYNINLCRLYIWRWNISANYDAKGRLKQIYMNGHPVHDKGDKLPTIDELKARAADSDKTKIAKIQKPRTQADLGENSIAAVLFDLDANYATETDQVLAGAGPTNADPENPGKMHLYTGVDPWRSIFDEERQPVIHPYLGQCTR